MKKLIHQYLSRGYFVRGNHLHVIGVPLKTFGISSSVLILELSKVFGLYKKELKWAVKGWIKKQNKGFDFNGFWSPTLNRWSFKTMCGTTLNSGFVWALYIPVVNTPSNTTFTNEVNQMAERYANVPINEEYYGTITVRHEQPNFIKSTPVETHPSLVWMG